MTQAALLRRAFAAIPPEPSTWSGVEARYVYLPDAHVRALHPDSMLVVGPRGSGKSFWWHALQNTQLVESLLAGDGQFPMPVGGRIPSFSGDHEQRGSRFTTSAGFGLGDDSTRPTKRELEGCLATALKPKAIWETVVLWQAAGASHSASPLPDLKDWEARATWLVSNPAEVSTMFRAIDEALVRRGVPHVVLFDALDRTSDDLAAATGLLKGLLQVVLDLRSRKALRAKVFARPDMLTPSVLAFTDASKVRASEVTLAWTKLELYGLLFAYLANAPDDQASQAFRDVSGCDWHVPLPGGWTVPRLLRRSETTQENTFVALAGPFMGTNSQRGNTYRWLPNHLADAHAVVSPRSFLAAMRAAAEGSSGSETALSWQAIQQGVRKASEIRANEILEDWPMVHEAMEALSGIVVPALHEEFLGRLDAAGLPAEDMIELLLTIGLMSKLVDGRINVPDLYRLHFGLKRKGGFIPATPK